MKYKKAKRLWKSGKISKKQWRKVKKRHKAKKCYKSQCGGSGHSITTKSVNNPDGKHNAIDHQQQLDRELAVAQSDREYHLDTR